jgi:ssDNA-binding Zn-finger/Zn-ribbon topoisomerase 1
VKPMPNSSYSDWEKEIPKMYKKEENQKDNFVMLPCPFCGGEGYIKEDRIINFNIGYDDFPYVVIICKKCSSMGQKVNIIFFNRFSNYTVQEFRESNVLRAKEELRYEEYMKKCKNEAIKLWNRRI